MRRRAALAFSGALLVCGCGGAVHQLPRVNDGEVAVALAEVRSADRGLQRRPVTDAEVAETFRAATSRIHDAALQVCREIGVGECNWQFRISRARDLNAAALPNGLIVLNRGLVEYATNDEEICMVIAHEVAHQAADHVMQSRRSQALGAAIGGVLAGLAGAAATYGQPNSARTIRTAVSYGMQAGVRLGHLSFSKEQEREADYLAALILYRAGVDLDKARGFFVAVARESGRTQTTMLDTHPMGADRLAAWDRAVAEIRASNGRLPPRAS